MVVLLCLNRSYTHALQRVTVFFFLISSGHQEGKEEGREEEGREEGRKKEGKEGGRKGGMKEGRKERLIDEI